MKHPSDSIEDRRQHPWAMVENELLRDPRISPQCKALYGLLITYGPQSIFPGQETLATCLGTSRQTIKRWLDDLRLQGLIDWENRAGTSNKYYILGYANFLQGVTPTLQGCNAHVTRDVTSTLHDLDPPILNQEPEEPPLADSPPADDLRFDEMPIPEESGANATLEDEIPEYELGEIAETEAMFNRTSGDKLSKEEFESRHNGLAAVTGQEMRVSHDIPGQPWCNEPVEAWCKLAGKSYAGMSIPTRIKLGGIFYKIGAATDGSPVQVAEAIGNFKAEHLWWEYEFEWPGDGFCNRLGMMLVPDAPPEPINLDSGGGDTRPIRL